MSSTQKYLEKYMSKPSSSDDYKKKKLKKKKSSSSSKTSLKRGNFVLHDEDQFSWKDTRSESDPDDLPVIEAPTAPVYKSSSSSWITVREGEPTREEILQRNVVPEWDDVENEDERPAIAGIVVENEALSSSSPKKLQQSRSGSRSRSRSRSVERMSSGAKAGLQTAEQVKRDMDRKQQEYLDRMRALDPSKSGRDSETVYRDAQGRKVDRVAEKIEAAAAKRREIEMQEKQMEWGKGLVQREEKEAKRKQMEQEKFKPLARYKDDADLNEELKDRERWNDPAAMFLTPGGVKKKKSKNAAPKYPQYQGSFPPNRYNIRPGYRWDGVDRSNGYEKDYFMRLNTKQHRAQEAHMWSTEDM
ncbi:Pre-mRNA-splicing factor cwc26 [Podila humilis]|nr:Pre-mRNA-splicing factor cwc26 [Podila humilis]